MRIGLSASLAAFAMVLAISLPVSATVVVNMDIEQMAPVAPVVLVGEVNRVESSWNKDKTKIHTRAWITPSEILKGPAKLGTVVVKTIGGKVGDTIAQLDGAPKFAEGEKVLVFLEPRKDGDGYLTIGLYMGKFKVFKDPKTGTEMVVRDMPESGVKIVGSNPVGVKLHSLDEVRALFAGGSK